MTRSKLAAMALLTGALSVTSLPTLAQSGNAASLWAANIDVELKRARSADDLRRLCGAAIDAVGRSCSFRRAASDGNGSTCVIVTIEPEHFNDMPRLVTFGREVLGCLSAGGAPMAAGTKR